MVLGFVIDWSYWWCKQETTRAFDFELVTIRDTIIVSSVLETTAVTGQGENFGLLGMVRRH